MNKRTFNLHNGKSGAAIKVRIIPWSGRGEINEILEDGTIVIHLTAQTSEERMNHALILFIAEILGVNSSQVEIVGGKPAGDKLITIIDLDRQIVQERILKKLG